MSSDDALLRQAVARAASLEELVLEAAVTLARVKYGHCMVPARVQIGRYTFRVIGKTATLLTELT